jgi:hypothetical protein
VECFLELRTVLDHPAVNRGVIELDAPFLHQFFDMARAQRVGKKRLSCCRINMGQFAGKCLSWTERN